MCKDLELRLYVDQVNCSRLEHAIPSKNTWKLSYVGCRGNVSTYRVARFVSRHLFSWLSWFCLRNVSLQNGSRYLSFHSVRTVPCERRPNKSKTPCSELLKLFLGTRHAALTKRRWSSNIRDDLLILERNTHLKQCFPV